MASNNNAKMYVRHKAAKRSAKKLSRKIENAVLAGDHQRAKRLTRVFLKSYDAKLIAVREANNSLPENRKVPTEQEHVIAESLNSWLGTKEKVSVWFEPKNNGGFRPLMNFGLENRALQILVLTVLKLWSSVLLHPTQYILNGGRSKACADVMSYLGEGNTWAVQIDVRSCFTSFEGEEVPGLLPLPRRVTQRVLLSQHLLTSTTGYINDPVALQAVRRGIPQGSIASPFVAEALLRPVAAAVPEGTLLVNYGDNFLGMAHDEAEAVSIAESLRGSLGSHPAGPLPLAVDGPNDIAVGFEFLGYRFSLEDGELLARPSPRNFEKFKSKLDKYFDPDFFTDDEAFDKGRRYIKSWCSSFREWKYIDVWEASHLMELMWARFSLP